MSDLELLFLVIAILYGWECACWLRRGSLGFLTWFGKRWRLTHPGTLLGNQRGGFIFAPPLPPLGAVLVGQPFPFAISVQGILAAANASNAGSRASGGTLMRWEDIQSVSVSGKKVTLNGRCYYTAASAPAAFQLARQLQELRKVSSDRRPAAIDELFRASLEIKSIQERWEGFSRRSARLKLLTNAVFAHLFLFAPWLIWQMGLRRCWLGLLLGLIALTSSTAIAFHRIHKAYYPEAEDDRFTHFLIILLSPVTTIRARDLLTRPLLEGFHPLAIAKSFCSEAAFLGFARRLLLELRHPVGPLAAPGGPLEADSRAAWVRAVDRFLQKNGVDEATLTRPPAPNDASCRSYCPRCEAQFTNSAGACADCGGVPLKAFSPVPAREAAGPAKKQAAPGADVTTGTR
jgi:hypothetical protein